MVLRLESLPTLDGVEHLREGKKPGNDLDADAVDGALEGSRGLLAVWSVGKWGIAQG